MSERAVMAILFLGGTTIAGCAVNYSKTPCFDNCGNDSTCQATCQQVGGPGNSPQSIPNCGQLGSPCIYQSSEPSSAPPQGKR